MKEINYSEIERKCKFALIEAGKISKKLKKDIKVNYKSKNQPVTNADLEINNFLKIFLQQLTPDYGWLSEESIDDKSRLKCENYWCLDPIDGTRSFIYNKPEYTISLALINQQTPILGFIYNPCTQEFFFSKKNFGSYCNEKRIFVNDKKKINDCIVAISSSEKKKWDSLNFLKNIEVIKMGSIAYKIALVAKGSVDIALSFTKKNDWDYRKKVRLEPNFRKCVGVTQEKGNSNNIRKDFVIQFYISIIILKKDEMRFYHILL